MKSASNLFLFLHTHYFFLCFHNVIVIVFFSLLNNDATDYSETHAHSKYSISAGESESKELTF